MSLEEQKEPATFTADGRIHAIVMKLVTEHKVVTKTAPSLWALVDIIDEKKEEFKNLPTYLHDKFGPGMYYLFNPNFDKIKITEQHAAVELRPATETQGIIVTPDMDNVTNVEDDCGDCPDKTPKQ